jgi:hypothetical protein
MQIKPPAKSEGEAAAVHQYELVFAGGGMCVPRLEIGCFVAYHNVEEGLCKQACALARLVRGGASPGAAAGAVGPIYFHCSQCDKIVWGDNILRVDLTCGIDCKYLTKW